MDVERVHGLDEGGVGGGVQLFLVGFAEEAFGEIFSQVRDNQSHKEKVDEHQQHRLQQPLSQHSMNLLRRWFRQCHQQRTENQRHNIHGNQYRVISMPLVPYLL